MIRERWEPGQVDECAYQKALKDASENYYQRALEIHKQQAEGIAEETRKADQKLQADRSKIRQDDLRLQGRDLDAEKEQLKQKLKEETDAIWAEQNRRLKEHPGDSGKHQSSSGVCEFHGVRCRSQGRTDRSAKAGN